MPLYRRVTLKEDKGSGGFIDTLENIKHFLEDCDDPEEYDVKIVFRPFTKNGLAKLSEFDGF